MTYRISEDCKGCAACAKKCPEDAITGKLKVRFDIDPDLCQECGTCFATCPQGAVIDPQGNRSPKKQRGKKTTSRIDPEICAGCRTCFLNCPQDAIRVIKKGTFLTTTYCRVDPKLCVGCGTCTRFCITGAVELIETVKTKLKKK